MLIAGGRDRTGQALASAEIYDPAQNIWQEVASLTASRAGHTTTLLADGRVLVAGGQNSEYLTSVEIFDPIENTWTRTGDMLLPRGYHTALLLDGGSVWVAGGWAGSSPLLETEVYHPESGQWTAAEALASPLDGHLATLLNNGGALITGRAQIEEPVIESVPAPRHQAEGSIFPMPSLGPTPTPEGAKSVTIGREAVIAKDAVASEAMEETSASISNYSRDTETARLFGVHEIYFTLAQPKTQGYNPYERLVTVTFDPPQAEASANMTVRAFYDNLNGDQETWRARLCRSAGRVEMGLFHGDQ